MVRVRLPEQQEPVTAWLGRAGGAPNVGHPPVLVSRATALVKWDF